MAKAGAVTMTEYPAARSSRARRSSRAAAPWSSGFSLAGAAAAGRASAAIGRHGGQPARPGPGRLVDPRSIPTTRSTSSRARSRSATASRTGFLQVLAEELDLDMSQMIYGTSVHGQPATSTSTVDTNVVLSTGGEGGSNAMSSTGGKIRAAGVVARQALLGLASTKLGVPVGEPLRKQGRRLGRRHDRHLRRARRRPAAQRDDPGVRVEHPPGRGRLEAGRPVHAGHDRACRGSTSRAR